MDGVVDSAKLAQANEFITRLPKGYHSVVGELGALLSGGQRQRIALARTYYRNPRILILDEATNALDPETVAMIAKTWDRIAAGRTVLITGHDAAELLPCDRIIRLNGHLCTADV